MNVCDACECVASCLRTGCKPIQSAPAMLHPKLTPDPRDEQKIIFWLKVGTAAFLCNVAILAFNTARWVGWL